MTEFEEKDWFGRKAEDAYTSFDKRKKLFDWEKKTTGGLSSYFLKGKNPGKDAAKMLGSMFKVMKVDAKLTQKSKGKLDTVRIPTELLYDADTQTYTSSMEEIDRFYGAALQNAGMKAFQTKEGYKRTRLIQNGGSGDKKGNSLLDMLELAVRQESVDAKLGSKFPGYLKFVQKQKLHMFNDGYEAPSPFASKNERLMDLLIRLLRFPGAVEEDELKEFSTQIKAIERTVKKMGGLPETEREILNFSRMLYKLIIDVEDEEPPKPEEEDSEGGPSGGSGESEDEKMEKLKSSAEKMMKSLHKEADGSMSDEDFEEFEEEMTGDPDLSYEDEGSAYDAPVKFISSETNKTDYVESASKVDRTKAKVLATLFQRKSKDYKYVIRGTKSGRFDTSKLVEARQGVPNVYERMGSVKTDKICIGVLVDESGSMMSDNKYRKAREAAIFINEVFGKLSDVELFIYGHTADVGSESTNVMVYREPGTPLDPYALGAIRARSNNRDGDAILATARRIRQRTKRNGILFVISDGQPAASNYGGHSAILDVQKKVKKSEALGFQVIQIAIESHVPSHEMFSHFVKMTDIASLPGDLVRYMSRRIHSIMKEHVS